MATMESKTCPAWSARTQNSSSNSCNDFSSYSLDQVNSIYKGSHKLNQASSRSHTVFTIKLKQGKNSSSINFVDLAGSERNWYFNSDETTAIKESIEINKSLFTLKKVINVLSHNTKYNKKDYVPFRESKLTTLLKQSLGGRSKWLIIACANIIDKYSDETLSTLNYASKAGSIINKPIQINDPKQRLIVEQRKQISDLTNELTKAHSHINTLYELKDNNIEHATTFNKADLSPAFSTVNDKTPKTTKNLVKNHKFIDKPSPMAVKSLNDFDADAIRKGLESSGDKTILIEKLIGVLKLAREVQNSNSVLRNDLSQMSSIIDDLNADIYEKQIEIDQLHSKHNTSSI